MTPTNGSVRPAPARGGHGEENRAVIPDEVHAALSERDALAKLVKTYRAQAESLAARLCLLQRALGIRVTDCMDWTEAELEAYCRRAAAALARQEGT